MEIHGYQREFVAQKPRSYRDLYAGLAAVILLLASFPLLAMLRYREGELAGTYRAVAEHSFATKDYKRAAFAFDRVMRDNPTDQDRYNLAVSLLETGERERGVKLMQRLAGDNIGGFAPAHVWLARELIKDNKQRDPDRIRLAINHLLQAKNTKYNNGEVDFLLADCYWHSGSTEKSLESLHQAAQRDNKYYYDLFRTCRQVRLVTATNESAIKGVEYYREYVPDHPMDRKARVRFAELLTWLEAFDMAHSVLQQGMQFDPDGNWHKAVAETYLARFRQGESKNEDYLTLLSHIEKAFDADPESTEVLRELTSFGINDTTGKIDEILEQALATGQHNAIVHFVVGARAMQSGRLNDGYFHMRRAYELNNRLAFAANNLAYMEFLKKDGDCERGLEIINDVLNRFPNEHAFRETRGQLLTKLKRWEDALNDLEFALPFFPKQKLLHASLAKCYQNLGQDSLAKRHTEILKNTP